MGKGRLRRQFRVPKSVLGAVLARARGGCLPQWRNTGKLRFMPASGLLRPESASARGVYRTFRLPMPPKMGRTPAGPTNKPHRHNPRWHEPEQHR